MQLNFVLQNLTCRPQVATVALAAGHCPCIRSIEAAEHSSANADLVQLGLTSNQADLVCKADLNEIHPPEPHELNSARGP